jgi:mRNA interferase MazF
MRPIHAARWDKVRPVRHPHSGCGSGSRRSRVTRTILGLSTEVPVGKANGLDHDCVISCDAIVTVPTSSLGHHVGYLLPSQETELADAIRATFDH